MKRSLTKSALLITALSVLSSLIALMVDAATAAYFGASTKMDAYLTATVIPNILAMTIPSTLAVVFVPIFHKISRERGEYEAWQAASKIFNALGLSLMILVLASLPLAEHIIALIAPGFSADLLSLASTLFRWLMVGSIFVALNALLVGLYNASFRFGLPAFMPIFRNTLTLLGIVFFSGYFGINVLAYIVLVAAVIQFVLLVPVLIKRGRYVCSISLHDPEIRDALRMALFMLIGGVAYSAYGIVDRYFGSSLPVGSISYLGYASKFGMFFSNIISVGIGTVAFSRFSSQAAAGDHNALAVDLIRTMSVITLFLLPSLAVVLALREPLLGLLFERKAFTSEAVVHTGYALLGYTGLLIVMGVGRPITLAYYSIKDAKTPVVINTISLFIYTPLIYLLCVVLDYGYLGIAISTSVIHLINCGLYMLILKKRIIGIKLSGFYHYAGKIFGYSMLVALLCTIAGVVSDSIATERYADLMSVVSGFIIWGSLMFYLFLKKDIYVLKIYNALMSRRSTV